MPLDLAKAPSSFRPPLLLAGALAASALLALLISAPPALAHGVAWNQEPSNKTITVSFIYADQQPMAYSQIKVFSPADSQIEYQNARTDKKGYFAFVPDAPGEWRFETSDGQGHLAQGAITVAPPAAPAAQEGGGAAQDAAPQEEPRLASGGSQGVHPSRVALGLSVILNLALIAAVFVKRGKAASKAATA
jgi:nickel transport protein